MSHPLSLLIFIFSSNYPPPVDLPPFSLPSLEFISFYFFFYFATKPLLHFGDVCYFSNLSPWIRRNNKYHRFLSNWKIHQLDPLKHHTILMLNIWEMRSKEQHLKLCLTKFDNQTFVSRTKRKQRLCTPTRTLSIQKLLCMRLSGSHYAKLSSFGKGKNNSSK